MPRRNPAPELSDRARKALLKELAKFDDDYEKLTSPAWAVLWYCDTGKLADIVNTLKTSNSTDPKYVDIGTYLGPRYLWDNAIGPFLGRSSNSASVPGSAVATPAASTPGSRSQSKKRKRSEAFVEEEQSPSERQRPVTFSTSTATAAIPPRPGPSPLTITTSLTTLPARPDASSPLASGLTDEPPMTPGKRDKRLAGLAYERDKKCVVTGTPSRWVLIGGHVFPFALGSRAHKLWDLLKCFWKDEDVESWAAALLSSTGQSTTESLKNIITMDCKVHKCWDDALFGLEPISISDDERSMVLKFHWLARNYKPKDLVPLSEVPCFSKSKIIGEDGFDFGYYGKTGKVNSGDNFTLKTKDPKQYPLPSFALLQMRWHLNRVAALCAGAEDEEISDGDESDEEAACLSYWDSEAQSSVSRQSAEFAY